MKLVFTIAITTILLPTAASACATFSQARKANPHSYIKYSIDDGERCWFAPGRSRKKSKFRGPTSTAIATLARPATAKTSAQASSESEDAGRVQDRSESTRPPIHNRVADVFTDVGYFTTMPWHDELWLRMQPYWLQANGVFSAQTWVMTARWP